MLRQIKSLLSSKSGVTSLEYGVLAAIIVVGLAAMLPAVKTALSTTFTTVNASL